MWASELNFVFDHTLFFIYFPYTKKMCFPFTKININMLKNVKFNLRENKAQFMTTSVPIFEPFKKRKEKMVC